MQIDPFADLDSDKITAPRPEAAAGAPARWASLTAHWRAWLPILMRVTATGLALLGLAGIGLAARGSSELPALARAPLTLGFAQMLGPGPLPAGAAERPAAVSGAVGPGDAAAPQCPCDEPVPCATSSGAAPGAAPRAAGVAGAASGGGGAVTADGRVVLNRAGALELQRLPGIGAKRAAAILELRHRLGRFRRTSDLLRVKGIGRRMLERMSPQLVLDAPSGAAVSAAPAGS